MNNTNLKEQLLQIPGVMINSTDAKSISIWKRSFTYNRICPTNKCRNISRKKMERDITVVV